MLKFIGTGSAFNTEFGTTSAYIKNEDTLLLIDCGETTFARIMELKLLEDVKKAYIMITHMHSDHIAGLAALIEYLNIYKQVTPNIILTTEDSCEKQEADIRQFLSLQGISEDDFDFTYSDMLDGILPNLKAVSLKEVKHSNKLTSYAVEMGFDDKNIYFTGDNNDKSYLRSIKKKLKKNDLLYTDCTTLEYKGRVHISLNELNEIFDEKDRNQIYVMHFDSYETVSLAKKAGYMVATREESLEEILKSIVNR